MPTRSWAATSLVATVMLSVAGCTRSIEWDEEVPLNTGETVWVHRSGSLRFGSAPGNPLDFGYQAEPKTRIAFTYRGRQYTYTSEVTLQVLAIAPDSTPNLVISASDYMWQFEHGYLCTRPSYVQLRPDVSGNQWTWPEHIEPWLYGLPTNLLVGLPANRPKPLRITAIERRSHNVRVFRAGDHFRQIDPNYQYPGCKR
jgi:hypothetical protein